MTDYDAALSGGAVLRLSVVTASQDVANNTSTLSWSLTLYKGSFSSFSYDPIPWSVSINGVGYAGGYTFDFSGGATSKLIASGSTVVTHAADGTPGPGKFVVSGYTGATGTSTGGPATASGTYVPATIPRASTPTFELVSAPGVLITECDAGLAIKLNMNRASSSFTHTIDYSIGSTGWQSIATGVGASYASWTIPLSLLNQIPSATSGALSIRVKTYSGATLIGEKTVTLTMKAGAAIVPDFGTITHSEATTSPNVASLIGAYVQGISKLSVALTSPAGIYGSTITAQKIEVVGQAGNQIANTSASSLSGTLPAFLNGSGSVTLRGTVTDSRGRTYSEDVTITVLAYSLPSIVSPIVLRRSLSGGTVDESGTYIRVDLNAAVQSLVVSASQKNAITYRISTSPRGANTWTVKATTTPGGLTFNSYAVIGTYSIADSFDVKVEVIDKLAVVAVIGQVSTSAVPLHLGADGVAVNKFHENGALDVGGAIYQSGLPVIDTGDMATDSIAGLVELLTNAEGLAGTDTARAVTAAVLKYVIDEVRKAFTTRNRVRNGAFRVNQRGASSGTSLGSSDYFLDGWRSTSSTNAVTWTGDIEAGRVLTIASGKAIRQTIERRDMPADTYTLSWEGTATGRIYKAGSSAPSYAASPITVSLDGADDVRVEFTNGTLGEVQVEAGSKASPFETVPYVHELLRCQRYYYRTTAATATSARLGMAGFQNTTTQAEAFFVLPVAMRTTPAVNVNSCYWTDGVNFSASITSISLPASVTYNVGPMLMTYVHWSGASGAALRPGTVSANGTGAYVEFSAEF